MTAIKEQDQPQAHAGDVCKNCGYCPHCGQSRQQAVPWYPYAPYGPYVRPLTPYIPSGPIWISMPQVTFGNGNASANFRITGNTNAADHGNYVVNGSSTQFTLT